jgi:hypothetical protein
VLAGKFERDHLNEASYWYARSGGVGRRGDCKWVVDSAAVKRHSANSAKVSLHDCMCEQKSSLLTAYYGKETFVSVGPWLEGSASLVSGHSLTIPNPPEFNTTSIAVLSSLLLVECGSQCKCICTKTASSDTQADPAGPAGVHGRELCLIEHEHAAAGPPADPRNVG